MNPFKSWLVLLVIYLGSHLTHLIRGAFLYRKTSGSSSYLQNVLPPHPVNISSVSFYRPGLLQATKGVSNRGEPNTADRTDSNDPADSAGQIGQWAVPGAAILCPSRSTQTPTNNDKGSNKVGPRVVGGSFFIDRYTYMCVLSC